ncbi:peptide ABC transporter substrate-binding protein [Ktedonobacter racemifer]|uniref:Extracellular solute-binding protein family 5 n=1 Tax=Ktedonobacter racemifer DSM 44963 TaxID=485913 RepID=D6TSF7_KTERA|nr:peptide ABC transporter substrate-binding protein [Ktedonobacter racemifer]EFH83358.1 extracellular solute-binding protein family 5 [Ktedonobacter racemifer DSM 44963]
MEPGKKPVLFLITCLCLLTMLLAACGSGSSGPSSTKASDDKQTLRYPVVGDPDINTFDPALVQDTDSNFPIQAVFTGLVTLDANLQVKPQLAESYQQSDGGLTWTFKLKPNLTFSNGDKLTSEDVVYSINRAIDPATKSSVSGYLQLVKGYKDFSGGKVKTLIGTSLLAPDPQTVVIKISQPAAYFLQTLSYPTSYVVNKKLVEKYGTQWTDHVEEGGGAGPWKVEKYTHNKGLELVRNDAYYGAKPQMKRLSVIFYKDQDSMYRAFQAQQLDFTPVPSTNLEQERSTPGFKETPILTIRYIAMNYLVKPFDNIKIRQAFALAINKDLIVQSAMKNAFTPSNHVIPKGMPGYNENLTGPLGTGTQGDANKAKQVLAEGLKDAGYASVSALPPITLTFYPRNQNFKDALTAIAQMWQTTLGIKVNINIVTRPKLLDLTTATKNNGSLQMWQAGWNADYPDPQDWLTLFFDKGQDYNQSNYGQNKVQDTSVQLEAQKKLEQADQEQDVTKRMQLYNEAEQQAINDVGWLPLWQEKVQYLVKTSVQNLSLNSQQLIPPDDWSKIYITQ